MVGSTFWANECFLMVLTEYLTKWAEVYPIPNKQATSVFKCLKKVIRRFGVPETIISDQGCEFCNELNDKGIDGLTERFNQTICGRLSKFSDGGKLNWEDDLDLILLGYRSSIQSSTLYSPFELVYGVKGIHTVKTYTYKSLLPKFNTPLPEEISPVDPLPERCF